MRFIIFYNDRGITKEKRFNADVFLDVFKDLNAFLAKYTIYQDQILSITRIDDPKSNGYREIKISKHLYPRIEDMTDRYEVHHPNGKFMCYGSKTLDNKFKEIDTLIDNLKMDILMVTLENE